MSVSRLGAKATERRFLRGAGSEGGFRSLKLVLGATILEARSVVAPPAAAAPAPALLPAAGRSL
jgi:hypothetical protein